MTTEQATNSPRHLHLRERLGFLFRDSLLYGGATAISRSFALITFPILARHFSVAEYGQLDFFMVLANLLALVVIFGQDSAVARFFYEDDDPEHRREVVSQSLLLQMVSCLIVIPLLWLSANKITPLLVAHEQSSLFYKVILLQLPFLVVINFSINLLKFSFARIKFIVMSLGMTAVQAIALVTAVVGFDAGIREILLIGLGVTACFSMLGLFFVRHWLIIPKRLNKVREMLLFAIPFGIICVTGAFSPTLERSLTERLLGSEQLGLYSVGVKIAMLMGLIISAFQTAWGPFSLSVYKQVDAADTYNWVLKIFALGACAMAFVLAFSGSFLIQLLATERYANAAVIVFPLAIGLAIQGTSWITEIGISISKQSQLGLFGYACMIAVTLALIICLAPNLGLLGVALAVLGGYISKAIIASWLAQKAYPLPWQYSPLIVLFVISLGFGLSGSFVARYHSATLASGLYVGGLFALLVVGPLVLFSPAERNKIIQILILRVSSRLSQRFQ